MNVLTLKCLVLHVGNVNRISIFISEDQLYIVASHVLIKVNDKMSWLITQSPR